MLPLLEDFKQHCTLKACLLPTERSCAFGNGLLEKSTGQILFIPATEGTFWHLHASSASIIVQLV